MDIFKYFVLVNQDSPLADKLLEQEDIFCYYADQKRTTYLMKFIDVLPLIEEKMKLKISDHNRNSILSCFLLNFGKPGQFNMKHLPDRRNKLIHQIQTKRC
jgi:hypothetical protein